MSDAVLLGQQPILWSHDGKDYHLAVADLDLELLFQAIHERWARNRIEAMAGGISEEAHRLNLSVFLEQLEMNRFAFMGRLSLGFLISDHGMAEYIQLLSQKGQRDHGGAVLSMAQMRGWQRHQKAVWDDLTEKVVRRDLPNLLAPEQGQPQPQQQPAGTQPITFTESSSPPSQDAPG